MEIKPTGLGANLPSVSNDDQQVNKPFSKQAEAAATAAELSSQQNLPLSSVLSEYRKSDLQDPAKVETMLSQCAGGLLSDSLGSKASLSKDESSYLTGWLQNDPSIRGKLLNYLERVLK